LGLLYRGIEVLVDRATAESCNELDDPAALVRARRVVALVRPQLANEAYELGGDSLAAGGVPEERLGVADSSLDGPKGGNSLAPLRCWILPHVLAHVGGDPHIGRVRAQRVPCICQEVGHPKFWDLPTVVNDDPHGHLPSSLSAGA
jgi:hypothetical protein